MGHGEMKNKNHLCEQSSTASVRGTATKGGGGGRWNDRMWWDQPPSRPLPRRTRLTTAVSPAGSQSREGREPVERAGRDARYGVVGQVPERGRWGGGEGGGVGKGKNEEEI